MIRLSVAIISALLPWSALAAEAYEPVEVGSDSSLEEPEGRLDCNGPEGLMVSATHASMQDVVLRLWSVNSSGSSISLDDTAVTPPPGPPADVIWLDDDTVIVLARAIPADSFLVRFDVVNGQLVYVDDKPLNGIWLESAARIDDGSFAVVGREFSTNRLYVSTWDDSFTQLDELIYATVAASDTAIAVRPAVELGSSTTWDPVAVVMTAGSQEDTFIYGYTIDGNGALTEQDKQETSDMVHFDITWIDEDVFGFSGIYDKEGGAYQPAFGLQFDSTEIYQYTDQSNIDVPVLEGAQVSRVAVAPFAALGDAGYVAVSNTEGLPVDVMRVGAFEIDLPDAPLIPGVYDYTPTDLFGRAQDVCFLSESRTGAGLFATLSSTGSQSSRVTTWSLSP